jgi:hypothetical protein
MQLRHLTEPEFIPSDGSTWDCKAFSLGENVETRAGVVGIQVLHQCAQDQAAALVECGLGDLLQQVPDRGALGILVEVEEPSACAPRYHVIELGIRGRALHTGPLKQELDTCTDQRAPLVIVTPI